MLVSFVRVEKQGSFEEELAEGEITFSSKGCEIQGFSPIFGQSSYFGTPSFPEEQGISEKSSQIFPKLFSDKFLIYLIHSKDFNHLKESL